MAFGKNKTLRVEFYEVRNNNFVGYDELRLKDVPEDFEAETYVDIDGDRWKVVGVEPSNPRKALKTGTLVVNVELVQRGEARPTQVVETENTATPVVEAVKEAPVFVAPSRADQLPRMSGKREDLRLLEMATWEWRNIEFTLSANRGTVQDVFGKIKELVSLNSTERDGRTFYTRQYERYDMFAPLRGTKLKLEQLIMDYFPAAVAVDGLTFMGSEQVANSTFVFMVGSGTVFYGQEFDEVVRYLALHRPDQLIVEALRADAEVLARLMKKKDLILVDWALRQIVEPEEEAILDYLLAGFAKDAVAIARQELAARSSIVHVEKPSDSSDDDNASAGEEVPLIVPVVIESAVEEATIENVVSLEVTEPVADVATPEGSPEITIDSTPIVDPQPDQLSPSLEPTSMDSSSDSGESSPSSMDSGMDSSSPSVDSSMDGSSDN